MEKLVNMPKSKISERSKVLKKKRVQEKILIKNKTNQMLNKLEQQPVTFVYAKDKETVEVPLKDWLVLNQSAKRLEDIAMFVATMEQIGRLHIDNQTLLPVFQDDLENSKEQNPDGSYKMQIKDSFWAKKSFETPTILKVDNEIVYEKETLVDVQGQPLN